MTLGMEDKVVAITGAGKGLGRAHALYLAGLGARIVVNNRRHAGDKESSADRVVSEIRKAGGAAIAEYSNVEDSGAGERLLNTALERFGQLDALIANAGVSEGRSFHKQNLEDFRRVIEINLMGTANALQAAFRHMYHKRSGAIVLTSSVAGLYGEHGLPAYSASKAAVYGLMYSLSKEGRAHGIRVNALAPYASTQMTEKDMPPELAGKLQPDHVAPVVAWLISEQCGLNGEIIISGAGRISRARNMETAPRNLIPGFMHEPETIQLAWDELDSLPLERAYMGGLEHFAKFISD